MRTLSGGPFKGECGEMNKANFFRNVITKRTDRLEVAGGGEMVSKENYRWRNLSTVKVCGKDLTIRDRGDSWTGGTNSGISWGGAPFSLKVNSVSRCERNKQGWRLGLVLMAQMERTSLKAVDSVYLKDRFGGYEQEGFFVAYSSMASISLPWYNWKTEF